MAPAPPYPCTYCNGPSVCLPDPDYYGPGRESDYRCAACATDLSAAVPLTRTIAGETWTVDPADGNRWHGPDAAPERSDENGFGHGRAIRQPEGFALRSATRVGRTGEWRTATKPLTPKQHDTRSILADPERRADWEAERRAANRARAFAIAAKRAELVALDTAERFAESCLPADVADRARRYDVALSAALDATPGIRVAAPRVTESKPGAPRRWRKVWHRMTSAAVILADINGEYQRARASQVVGAAAFTYHEGRARTIYAPVRKAMMAKSAKNYRARVVASETAEQREARLAKAATRARKHRAAKLAERRMLTADDATA